MRASSLESWFLRLEGLDFLLFPYFRFSSECLGSWLADTMVQINVRLWFESNTAATMLGVEVRPQALSSARSNGVTDHVVYYMIIVV